MNSTTSDIIDNMRQHFPHGHPSFLPITVGELQLHSDKNHDYAAGGSPLGNFERVSAILALYPKLNLADKKVIALVYALKQLDAVLWGINSGIKHKVEGLKDRLQDISVYSKIVMCMCDDEARAAYATGAESAVGQGGSRQLGEAEPGPGTYIPVRTLGEVPARVSLTQRPAPIYEARERG